MASSGERRLLFDTRGKRKHVIRVVYAILALLMGTSLFLVIGPVNIGELIGNSTSGSSATEVLDEQAERIERRLAKDPKNEALLLALTRARINTGNSQIEVTPGNELPNIPTSAKADFESAFQTWSRYLKQAGNEPSASGAQLVAITFLRLAESGSSSYAEVERNLELAAKAQQIAVDRQPSLGTLSSLAIYEYFSGDFAAADKTSKRAVAEVPAKNEAKSVEEQLAKYSKRAKGFQKQVEQEAKEIQKASKESLQSPLGGLAAGATPSE
jgi:hypothetical protein